MRPLKTLARLIFTAGLVLASVAPNAALAGEAPPPPAIISAGEQVEYARPFGCPWTSAIYTAAPNQAIPDPGLTTSSVIASGLSTFTWQVQVTTTIQHPSNAELAVYLISPSGTRVTLTTGNGDTNSNVFNGTVWRDDAGKTNAPGPVTLAAFANGVTESPLAPEEPLGTLRAENPNGTWTLEVRDLSGTNAGTLVSWSLGLEALAVAPPIENEGDSDSTESAIPDDGTPVTRTYTIPSAPVQSVAAVWLTTVITHPHPSDLVIELKTNAGQIITIADHQGGYNANVFAGTLWEEYNGNEAEALTDYEFFNDVVATHLYPQEPMSAANGLSAAGGQWQLIVRDTVPGSIGSLGETTLGATSYACQPDLQTYTDQPAGARLDAPGPMRIQVVNNGMDTSTPVSLTTTLPTSLSFHDAAGAGWNCGGVAPGAVGGTLTCIRPSLAAGATATVTLRFNPPAAPMGTGFDPLVVTALTAGDSAPGNNTQNGGLIFSYHSANGQPWDITDQAVFPFFDTGAMPDGGQEAFGGWGFLRLRMFNPGGNLIYATDYWEKNFGLVSQGPNYHWHTTHPVVIETLEISRDLYAPADADWLRYVDTFHNLGAAQRTVWVGWGGFLGSGNATETTDTSSGDAVLTAGDTWAATRTTSDIYLTPPVGFALRSPADTTYQGPSVFFTEPFTNTWPSAGNGLLGHVYKLVLDPGESASLAYFVYRGLAEGVPGPGDCEWYGDCVPGPADGSQVALAETTVAALAAAPNFCGLSGTQIASIVNWPGVQTAVTCDTRLYLPFMKR